MKQHAPSSELREKKGFWHNLDLVSTVSFIGAASLG